MNAKDIMTPNVITVKKNDSVEHAIKLLLENNVTGLPVVDEKNHVLGIITEGDLIYRGGEITPPRYLAIFDSYIFLDSPNKFEKQLKKMTGMFVEDVMTSPVIVKLDLTSSKISKTVSPSKFDKPRRSFGSLRLSELSSTIKGKSSASAIKRPSNSRYYKTDFGQVRK